MTTTEASANPPAGSTSDGTSGAAPDGAHKRPHNTGITTRHSVRLADGDLPYTATAGTIVLDDEAGAAGAEVFYVSYVVESSDAASRPVTFLFNGGPGSPTTFLLLGSIGPVRLQTGDTESTAPAPYVVVENPHTLLDRTDLVFIDAVGTGFSTLVHSDAKSSFWGIDQDARAFADFITRYLSSNDRWNSPKYIIGESYGTTRSGALVRILQDQAIAVNGLALVSTILDYGVRMSRNDQHYIGLLPTFAVTAQHHGRAGAGFTLEEFAQEAREFADGDFARALARGHSLDAAELAGVARRVEYFIGIDARYIERSLLRVEPDRFRKELLRDEAKAIGFYDGRVVGDDLDGAGGETTYRVDSVYNGSAFHSAANDYLRRTLQYRPDGERRHRGPIDSSAGDWDWTHVVPTRGAWKVLPWGNTITDLAHTIVHNPHLKVLVANGYFDLCTPFLQAEHDLDHLLLPAPLRANIAFTYYPGGHMMYLGEENLVAFVRDLRHFYDGEVADLAQLDARPPAVGNVVLA